MQTLNISIPHHELTSLILKCCFEVINELGTGFLENVYKNSLLVALKEEGAIVATEKNYDVYFKGIKVGLYRADIVVNNAVIVEIKSCASLLPEHQAQTINYLKAAGLQVGLIVNFGSKKLDFRRVYHPNCQPY